MALAFDATSTAQGDGVTSFSWSHTCTGANRALIVGTSNWDTPPILNPTVDYNSVSMTQEGTDDTDTDGGRVSIYSLIAPATGSNTVLVTFGGTSYGVGGAVSYTGADQADCAENWAANNGTNATPTVNITSATGDFVQDVTGNYLETITVDGSQTQRWNDVVTDSITGAGSTEAGAASVTMSWSLSASEAWEIGGVSIKAAAVSGRIMSSLVNNGGLVGRGGIAGQGGGLAG